jgi:DNA-binding GntR family transcriptional regulator
VLACHLIGNSGGWRKFNSMKVLAESSTLRGRTVRPDRKRRASMQSIDAAPELATIAVAAPPVTAHETVYRQLKDRILFGGFLPGEPVTLRGLSDELQIGMMPIREAVRRLTAERALEMRDNRRVLVPPMTRQRFDQILFARLAFEPELAARAATFLTPALIDTIEAIDNSIDLSVLKGDAERYMRGNYQFHFTLYELTKADVLCQLAEGIWLQFGPFMRMAYGRVGTGELTDHHEQAIAAMRAGSAPALRQAIADDISQGMGFIGESLLGAG